MLSALCCFGQGAGYWHTSGNHILDANNKQVRIAGINWYGFETPTQTVNGLYDQDYKSILQLLKTQGFNTVRIPLSSQMIEAPGANLNLSYSNHAGPINADLRGLNAMQVLDSIVSYAGEIGLKVILDHHRSEAGSSAEANGLWFTAAYPESAWIADWTALADRYLGNPTVIGFDLHNEPHMVANGGACWDCGGPNDWHLAAERAGNAVLSVNPNLLIFVEGTDVYNGDYYWWGGNLEGVQKSPVALSQPGHLVYSAHDYGPTEAKQAWFTASTSYTSLSAVWNKHWAYISQQNIAPVWLGEFGSTNAAVDLHSDVAGSEGQWFASMVQYLAANPNLSWSYWAANGEDRYGYLDTTYAATASAAKAAMLASIDDPLKTASVTPPAPSNLTAKAVSSSGVALGWTIVAGSGLTFAIFFGTHAGHTDTVLANNVNATSYQASNLNPGTQYFFTVKTLSQGVASAASNEATATTPAPQGPPPAPNSLVAIAASTTQINVAWTPIAAAGATYTLYGGTSAANINSAIATGVSASSYLVTGLNPATAYYFKVKASVQGVSSALSAIATATTKAAPAPAAPMGLTASVQSASQINLSWAASATKQVTYNVYAATTASSDGTLLATGVNGMTYQANGLTPGTTYFFTVKAVLGGTASTASNVVSATTQKAVATGGCHVSYDASNDWGTGFTAKVAITNTGTAALKSWTLTWTYSGSQQMTQSWSSGYSQTGQAVTLSNVAWNGPIAPNATNSGIGFQATYTGKNVAPAVFYVNGVACK